MPRALPLRQYKEPKFHYLFLLLSIVPKHSAKPQNLLVLSTGRLMRERVLLLLSFNKSLLIFLLVILITSTILHIYMCVKIKRIWKSKTQSINFSSATFSVNSDPYYMQMVVQRVLISTVAVDYYLLIVCMVYYFLYVPKWPLIFKAIFIYFVQKSIVLKFSISTHKIISAIPLTRKEDPLDTYIEKPLVKYSCTQSTICLKIGPLHERPCMASRRTAHSTDPVRFLKTLNMMNWSYHF